MCKIYKYTYALSDLIGDKLLDGDIEDVMEVSSSEPNASHFFPEAKSIARLAHFLALLDRPLFFSMMRRNRNMTTPQISPIAGTRRSRNANYFADSERAMISRESSSSLCKSPGNIAPKSPQMNGDYQVLQQSVEQQRSSVERERASLAQALDRLGDHHVRNKEYDEAMNAFTEALHEKRSVYSQRKREVQVSTKSQIDVQESDEGDSLLDSIITTADCQEQLVSVDDIIHTLRNMGNVHSLRGEQDEAIRYYSEVTSLRASRQPNQESISGINKLDCMEDEKSAMLSELNEDIQALDELFRNISFRNGELSDVGVESNNTNVSDQDTTLSEGNRKRRRGDNNKLDQPELFKRSSSTASTDSTWRATSNDELSEALDLYRSMIESSSWQGLEQHEEKLNSFALRADIIHHNKKRVRLEFRKDTHAKVPEEENTREEELELALEVYKQALDAQEDIRSHPLQDSDAEPAASAKLASTLIRMGSLYYKLNDVDEELQMYKEANAIYRLAYGQDHPYVAGTRKNIGMVLAERGEYEASMNQFEKAKSIYLAVNDGNEESRDVASAISCMANVKNRMGELDGALVEYMKALDIYKSIVAKMQENDEEDISDAVRDVTSTIKIVGMVHAKKGDLDTAMSFFNEAMDVLRNSASKGSRDKEGTSSILTRIAGIHYKKGEYDKAMSTYSEAYDLATEANGNVNHPDIAGILHYIGGINHKQGRLSEAMSYYQEAVRIYQATLGPGNPAVATTLVCIGSIHYKQRQLDRSIMFYREAFRLNRDAYGLHHPDVAPTLKSIGMILAKKGDFTEAYDIFRDVLSIKCTVFGTCHPEVANAYKSLGNVHYKRGELADAEREYRHALSIYRRTKGENHKETVAARTTIEHLRQHMRERGRRSSSGTSSRKETRQMDNTSRVDDEERSC